MDISEIELEAYGEHRPTPFDTRGLMAESMGHGQNGEDDTDRSEWLIVPCSRTRDSGPLDESNFASAEKMLEAADPSGTDWENHRFGHWGPGWYEILIVRPGTKAHRAAQEIAASLENYPVLDEDDLSERETEAEEEGWRNFGRSDMVSILARTAGVDTDAFDDVSDDALRSLVLVEQESDGPRFRIDPMTCIDDILSLPGLKVAEGDE